MCGATYSPTRPQEPVLDGVGRHAGAEVIGTLFLQAVGRELQAFLREWTQLGTRCSPKPPTRLDEWFEGRRRSPTGTSRAMPPTSVSKYPARPASTSTSGSTRPIGYFGSFRNYCDKQTAAGKPVDFDAFTDARKAASENTEMIHFIGKDILYFHALFWPAMLEMAGYRTPNQVYAHGFLDCRRREDVQIARHLHHRAELPRTRPQPGMAALLLRRQAGRRLWRT